MSSVAGDWWPSESRPSLSSETCQYACRTLGAMASGCPCVTSSVVSTPRPTHAVRTRSPPGSRPASRADRRAADETEPAGRGAVVQDAEPGVEAIPPEHQRPVDLAIDLQARRANALADRYGFKLGKCAHPDRRSSRLPPQPPAGADKYEKSEQPKPGTSLTRHNSPLPSFVLMSASSSGTGASSSSLSPRLLSARHADTHERLVRGRPAQACLAARPAILFSLCHHLHPCIRCGVWLIPIRAAGNLA